MKYCNYALMIRQLWEFTTPKLNISLKLAKQDVFKKYVNYNSVWGFFRYFLAKNNFPLAKVVATAIKLSAWIVFCESVGRTHTSQISSNYEGAESLLKLVKLTYRYFQYHSINSHHKQQELFLTLYDYCGVPNNKKNLKQYYQEKA